MTNKKRTEERTETRECDLISRQAAIDAVVDCTICGTEDKLRAYSTKHSLENDWIGGLVDALDAIKELPSAQPEPKWIPCDETVDIPDHEVMACDRYGEFIIGYLDCKDEQWLCESDDSLMYNPVAWCELPKPYKEGGADG